MRGRFLEDHKIVIAAVPLNTTGAAMDGVWCSMREWQNAAIFLFAGAWAGGTPAVTVEQATDFAAGGAKAVTFTVAHYISLTSDVPTLATVVSSTFNLGTANRSYVIDLNSNMLDGGNGFHTFRGRVATPGANNDLLGMAYILWNGSYQSDAARTAIV